MIFFFLFLFPGQGAALDQGGKEWTVEKLKDLILLTNSTCGASRASPVRAANGWEDRSPDTFRQGERKGSAEALLLMRARGPASEGGFAQRFFWEK